MATRVTFDPATEKNLQTWLEGDYDKETKQELRRILRKDPEAIIDAFYKNLEFGTGGLRGIMGLGPNRINRYTVAFVTQGLANYLQQQVSGQPKVIIGYDCRHHSAEFALEAAQVLAGNGIAVLLMQELRPTPMVSFGCRYYGCDAGIMITASHNPLQYNGYKVYWSDGAQVLPPHDVGIIAEVNQIYAPNQVEKAASDDPLIEQIGEALDAAYLAATAALQLYPEQNRQYGQQLQMVYTALHGTGATMVPSLLKKWDLPYVIGVKSQNEPDGDFPTITAPNPEVLTALQLGVDLLINTDSDLLIATDCDTDRVGVVVRHHGRPYPLDGNQIACLCLEHVLRAHTKQGNMPPNPAVIKTIVTSELFAKIAAAHQCACIDVLPGFKYIGELMTQWEQDPQHGHQFLFGAEESYGYLLGTHTRDKDAIIICSLICELALDAKLAGQSLIDRLDELYCDHGIYREQLKSLTFTGKQGAEQVQQMLQMLRQQPPAILAGSDVIAIDDYLNGERHDLTNGEHSPIELPRSNVLCYWLADDSKLIIRPSGTEPKIKLYCGTRVKAKPPLANGIMAADERAATLLSTLEDLIS